MALPNYSFIDDLLGGIRKQTDDAAAYRTQQDDLRMRLALAQEGAGPETYDAMRQIYGDRFPGMFDAQHSLDYLRGMREADNREVELLSRPSADQIQAGANALGVAPRPALPALGPTAQTFLQPQPPMALPSFEAPQTPAPAMSPTLQMAAGAVPEPTERNPLGRLFPGTTEVLKSQDALANRANPTLTAAQQMAMDRITGRRRKSDSQLLAEAPVRLAGRGYVNKQDAAATALDQKLNKMGIEEIMALIKVAGAVNKDTDTSGKVVNAAGKQILGEANAAQKGRNAAIAAGQRASSSGRDQWLEAQKAKLASAEKELTQTQGELGKMSAYPMGSKKLRKVELETTTKSLKREIQNIKDSISTRFPGE